MRSTARAEKDWLTVRPNSAAVPCSRMRRLHPVGIRTEPHFGDPEISFAAIPSGVKTHGATPVIRKRFRLHPRRACACMPDGRVSRALFRAFELPCR